MFQQRRSDVRGAVIPRPSKELANLDRVEVNDVFHGYSIAERKPFVKLNLGFFYSF